MKNIHVLNQQIYITTDEKIKEGDWIIDLVRNEISKANGLSNGDDYIVLDSDSFTTANQCKKIVLTTDFNLAPDVQKINDEFLEWFVKNPTCESVEVEEVYPLNCCIKKEGKTKMNNGCMERNRCLSYKIIIPQEEPKSHIEYTNTNDFTSMIYNSQKEELKTGYVKSETEFLGVEFTLKDGSKKFIPKQEPLEEAAKEFYPPTTTDLICSPKLVRDAFIAGAKWQAERMYSEKELFQIIAEILHTPALRDGSWEDIGEWFEQFKKK